MTVKRVESHFRKWHIGDEATIAHLVRSLAPEDASSEPRVHEAMTETGLVVEAQVRKTWDHPVIGLAIF